MSGLSVAGIASGIDSDSIISQMVALETRSVAKLQQRIAFEEAERLTFEDITSRLEALRTSSSAFAADTLFSSLSATSSDESILSVTATDAAPRGTHKVKVLQTALAHRIGGSGVEDPIGTKLAAGFTKTDFAGGTLLSAVASGSKNIDKAASSTFDYNANVSLAGQYTGTDNVSVTVELLTDVPGANGNVDVRISTDGINFQTHTVNVAGGVISLDSATYFGNNGVSMTINNADNTMKDGDKLMFRARGKASIEYTVGDGERKELIIESDDTLSEVVRAINDDADFGIRADILNDGSPTNPYRLILTSLTEGTAGKLDILSNTSIVDLDGVFAESPVSDSLTYTGTASVEGTLASGAGNNTILVEMIEAGTIGAAKFRISADGGLTFHDNDGAGFTLAGPAGDGSYSFDLDAAQKNGAAGNIFSSALNVDLKFTDDGSDFSVGDRITVDLFDAEIQSAQDALININGINLVKSSNVVDDVFSGLTINLQDANPDKTININITEKAGDITAAMNGFVESYNSAMSLIHAQSKFNPDEDTDAPLLMGDATVRQIQSSLQRYVTGRISILNGDTLSSLTDIGVSTDSKTGQLVFDSSKLSKALTDDPNAVRRLLSRFGDVVDGSNVSFVGSTSATKAGTYSVNVTQARKRAEVTGGANAQTITVAERVTFAVNTDTQGTGSISSMVVDLTVGMTPAQQVQAIQAEFTKRSIDVSATLEDGKIIVRHNQYGDDFKIDVTSDQAAGESGFTNVTSTNTGVDLKGTINNVEADVEGDVLVGKSGFGFEDLRVKVSNDFLGNAGQIRLNDGLGSSFTSLLDSFVGFGGVLGTKIQSFDSTISRIEQQVNRVAERAELLETRLRKQFVNLEVTLGRLNATGEFLTAQLKTLPGVQINKK